MNTSKIEIPELRKIKDAAKLTMKESFNIPKGVPQLALVDIADPLTRAFILEGLSAIGIANVVIGTDDVSGRRYAGARETLSENDLYAFDLFVYDGEAEWLDVVKCMKAGVVPVMSERNVFASLLKDFNPMKFEGNGFFFSSNNPYCMFEKVVCYLENIKFPEDRRILLKHVVETF